MLLKASKLSVELIKYISAFVTEGTFHFLIDRWGRTLNDYVKSPWAVQLCGYYIDSSDQMEG